ncbi:MAG TPA: DUF3300 domain-containing protein [Candidatus Acidoferrales bacterium]|nr:DUF3300 domain-containing protein [Candidatus Acidoferrales bacterium]
MTLPTRYMRVETWRGADVYARGAKFAKPRWGQQILAMILAIGLLFVALPENLAAQDSQAPPQDAQAPAQDAQASQQGTSAPSYTTQTPEQLDQLVAPIALYPDSLVAQILAASTFPAEVVEADRWLQANPDLKGDDLAKAVDQQTWDPSVKALTAFPSVLGNMDKNLSWASSLGDAYYNQQSDVMNAIQVMRQKAQQTGNLKDTSQQTVQTQGSDIVIEPAQPDVVYVPAYDPWLVYGYPIAPWPFWYNYPGIWFGGPFLSFGVGFGIGFYGGYGWGWHNWGANWGGRTVVYNHNTYVSHSNTFYNRNNYYRNGGARGVANNVSGRGNGREGDIGGRGGVEHNDGTHGANNANHGGNIGERGAEQNRSGERAFNGDSRQARGFGDGRGESGTRSSGFGGFSHGGDARTFSSRGQSSFGGGGGGFRGGGGGGGRHR